MFPLPWRERARVRGCGFTYELLSKLVISSSLATVLPCFHMSVIIRLDRIIQGFPCKRESSSLIVPRFREDRLDSMNPRSESRAGKSGNDNFSDTPQLASGRFIPHNMKFSLYLLLFFFNLSFPKIGRMIYLV